MLKIGGNVFKLNHNRSSLSLRSGFSVPSLRGLSFSVEVFSIFLFRTNCVAVKTGD